MRDFNGYIRKKWAIREAEEKGLIADSIEYRTELMQRVSEGSLTLEQAQELLAQKKKAAKKDGLLTRRQIWARS